LNSDDFPCIADDEHGSEEQNRAKADAECEANASLIAAAPEMLAALKALLPEVDAEVEQRQTSGNDEYWQGLKALSDTGHAAIAKAEGRQP
jgi:hypothetical protein